MIAKTAAALVCIVVHQAGPIGPIPASDIPLYTASGPNHNRAPFADYERVGCDQSQNDMLREYLGEIRRRQNERCPACFPNGSPWSRR
jgi:hypothetical protein